MTVTAVRTRRVSAGELSLEALLDESLPQLSPRTIVGITSKVVSLCEGRVADPESVSKERLIEGEADRYLPPSSSRYHVSLTIKDNTLIPSSGIDESNTGGKLVLWPADPQRSANAVWEQLAARSGTPEIGVIITDSTTSPLRMGVCGIPIAHAGFRAINDFVGTDDLFGRPLAMTRSNVAAGLAAAAVAVMGEAAEQTPIALISDVPFVEFQHRLPTQDELADLVIEPEDDLYAPVLGSVEWRPGLRSRSGGR
jgi:putative folate metabolism gamma-glutamate ligase